MSDYIFEIIPLVGVGPIKFGMTIPEVREIMMDFGTPTTYGGTDFYLNRCFNVQFSYGNSTPPTAYAVELDNRFYGGPIQAIYAGKDIFTLTQEECRLHLMECTALKATCDTPTDLAYAELDLKIEKCLSATENRINTMDYTHPGYYNNAYTGKGNTLEWIEILKYGC